MAYPYDVIVNLYTKLNYPIAITSITGEYGNADINSPELRITTSLTGSVPMAFHLDDSQLDVVTSLTGDIWSFPAQKNFVSWSRIGDASFEIDLVNDAGFRVMPWEGYVHRIMPLDGKAIIYGANGIAEMYPVSEPMPTFGLNQISSIGIPNAACVAGNAEVHFFIDTNYMLWMHTRPVTTTIYHTAAVQENKHPGLTLLGYQEYMKVLWEGYSKEVLRIAMCYDDLNRILYLSNGSIGYSLTIYGLGGGYKFLTSVISSAKENLYGAITPPIDLIQGTTQYEALNICADIFDFGTRSLKTLCSLEIGTDMTENLYVAVDYRYNKIEPWRTSPWKLVNKEGVGFPNVSGVEFRPRIKTLKRTDLDIDYINFKYKVVDKRYAGFAQKTGGSNDNQTN